MNLIGFIEMLAVAQKASGREEKSRSSHFNLEERNLVQILNKTFVELSVLLC